MYVVTNEEELTALESVLGSDFGIGEWQNGKAVDCIFFISLKGRLHEGKSTQCFHIGPLIRRESVYKNDLRKQRKALFSQIILLVCWIFNTSVL